LEELLGTFRVVPHVAALAGAYALALPIGWERERAERSAGLPALAETLVERLTARCDLLEEILDERKRREAEPPGG
jgi:hypothetical protein